MRIERVVAVSNFRFLGCGLGTRICLASRLPDRCDSDALHQHDRECKAAEQHASQAWPMECNSPHDRHSEAECKVARALCLSSRSYRVRVPAASPMPSWWNQQTRYAQNVVTR